ncbi:MAG: DNA replication/repair protein RecF [Candidatus Gastranaerophilales bacterium]|nr:DNA replication/repair protein RecF [Candidatus Gastranaerophilales bacterium]
MFINNIQLKNYRNYEDLSIDLSSKKILLIGKNAQGKTNLLEAIYYLSSLNSIRAKTDAELIKWGSQFASIKAGFNKNDIEIELDILINPPKKKILKINGLKKSKSAEFISCLSTVSFSSSDLLLLRGAPDDRRKWLDLAISQIYPAYIDRLAKFNKIRIQKNNYLKSLKTNLSSDTSILDVWNEQFAIAGSNIIFIRLNFLKEIQKIANKKHSEISKSENLKLEYNSTICGNVFADENNTPNIEEILKQFNENLNLKKQEEIIRAQSVIGPHRDDLSFYINNIDSKKFASQGQQRTIVLALKLAELQIIKNKTGENAILLLDDVLAELDNLRQNYLLDAIGENTQTVITSVDTLHFDKKYLENVKIYTIDSNENGAFITKNQNI